MSLAPLSPVSVPALSLHEDSRQDRARQPGDFFLHAGGMNMAEFRREAGTSRAAVPTGHCPWAAPGG